MFADRTTMILAMCESSLVRKPLRRCVAVRGEASTSVL